MKIDILKRSVKNNHNLLFAIEIFTVTKHSNYFVIHRLFHDFLIVVVDYTKVHVVHSQYNVIDCFGENRYLLEYSMLYMSACC